MVPWNIMNNLAIAHTMYINVIWEFEQSAQEGSILKMKFILNVYF